MGRFLQHEPSDASTSVFPYRFQVSSVSFCHTAAPCQQAGISTITTKGEQEGSLQEWFVLLCRCPGKEEQREKTQTAVTAAAKEPAEFTKNGHEARDGSIPLCCSKFTYL